MTRLTLQNKSLLLQQLCESNFRKLVVLVPDLFNIENELTASAPGKPDLRLGIVEKSKHTLILELNHCFSIDSEHGLPRIRIRVYQDAQLLEVIEHYGRPDVYARCQQRLEATQILDYKWKMNYFLQRWLIHCEHAHYRLQHRELRIESALNTSLNSNLITSKTTSI